MGLVQLLLLTHAIVRLEAAADFAARSYLVHARQTSVRIDVRGSLRAHESAAMLLAPASPTATGAARSIAGQFLEWGGDRVGFGGRAANVIDRAVSGAVNSMDRVPVAGDLFIGLDKFIYAYDYSTIGVCHLAKPDGDQNDWTDTALRMTVSFSYPLLVPVVGPMLADGTKAPGSMAGFRSSHIASGLNTLTGTNLSDAIQSLADIAHPIFAAFPKRQLRATVDFLWPHADPPEPRHQHACKGAKA